MLTDYGRLMVNPKDELLSTTGLLKLRAQKADVHKVMQRLVESGLEDGSIEPGDARMIAFTLAGALNWAAKWQDPEKVNSMDTTAVAIVDTLTKRLARR